MATSKLTLVRPDGTMTHALVRVQEEAARLTSTEPVLVDNRWMVRTPETVEPAGTGSGRSTDVTCAVVVPAKEQVTPPPAAAGPAVVTPTAPKVSSARGRAS